MQRKPAVMSAALTKIIEADNESLIHVYFASSVFRRTKRNMNARYQKPDGPTAIMYAASRGYFNAVRALLKYEDVDIADRIGTGYDLFNLIAKSLETHGANDQQKFNLLYAIMRLERFNFNIANFDNQAVLWSMAHNADTHRFLQTLINKGANPNTHADDRYPLYYAVLKNNSEVIWVLLGAKISPAHLASGCYAAIGIGNLAAFELIMKHPLADPDLNLGRWMTEDDRQYHWERYQFADLIAKRIDVPAYQAMAKIWVSHPKFDVRQFDSALLFNISVLARKYDCHQLLADVIHHSAVTFNVTDAKPRKLVVVIDEPAIKAYLLNHPDAQRIMKAGDAVLQDLLKESGQVDAPSRKLVRTASIYSARSVLYSNATSISSMNAEPTVEEAKKVRFG